MNKVLYRITEHCQEIRFANMDWEKFIADPFNYLYGISDQNFIDVDKEFELKEEAKKYIAGHPILISRFPDYFLIQWLELNKVTFDEDSEEISCDLFSVSELDLSNVPIVSNFDLISALNKQEGDL